MYWEKNYLKANIQACSQNKVSKYLTTHEPCNQYFKIGPKSATPLIPLHLAQLITEKFKKITISGFASSPCPQWRRVGKRLSTTYLEWKDYAITRKNWITFNSLAGGDLAWRVPHSEIWLHHIESWGGNPYFSTMGKSIKINVI